MAWAERLKSGRYRGVYRDRAGKRRTLRDTYTQSAEAKREAGIKEDEVRRRPAARARAGKLAWGQWCDEWLAEHRKVEPGTQGRDDSRIERHLMPYWRDVALRDIDRDAVVEWVEVLKTTSRYGASGDSPERLKPGTILKVVNLFSASMRAAVVAGKIDYSPCHNLQLERPGPDDEYYLEASEFDRFVSAADELTQMVAEFGVGTGLRWGEIAGMHRSRIALDRRRVLVQEVLDKERTEIKPYPKGRLRRGVPITAELAGKLQAWMESHPPVRCRTPHRGKKKSCDGYLLFPSQAGTVLNYGNFRRRHWDHAVTEAGLDGFTPHDLRHTYASWLIQSKRVTLDELGALLGHQDRSTTQRYAHLGEEYWDDVRDVLGDEQSDETSVRATIARLAKERPDEWAAVAAALDGGNDESPDNVAPHLPHDTDEEEGGKIVYLSDRSRSTG